MSSSRKPDERLDNLTALRFFAALLVVLHHAEFLRTSLPATHLLNRLSAFGYSGVTFFFIMSGFVLAKAYDQRLTPTVRGIFGFYWARLTKIIPLWFLASLPQFVRLGVATPAFLYYIFFLQAWHPDPGIASSYLSVAWTLSAEFFFYLTFPLFLLTTARPARSRLAGPVMIFIGLATPFIGALCYAAQGVTDVYAAVGSLGTPHRWLYRMPLVRIAEFVLGIGLFYVYRDYRRDLRRFAPSLVGLALIAFWAVIMTMCSSPWTISATFVPIGAALVLGLALLDQSFVRERLSLFVLLGEASFALYLVHQAYIVPLFPDAASHPFLSLFGIVVSAVAASVGLYLGIERPALRWLRRLDPSRLPSRFGRRSRPKSAVRPIDGRSA